MRELKFVCVCVCVCTCVGVGVFTYVSCSFCTCTLISMVDSETNIGERAPFRLLQGGGGFAYML